MKLGSKMLLAITIATVCLLAVACGKEQNNASGISASQPASDTNQNAVILFQDAAIYVEKDDEMVYSSKAAIAENVQWLNETKIATRASDGKERNFAKIVSSDGKSYWIQDVFVADKAVPGIILGSDTVLYRKADLASPAGKVLPENTLIAVHPAGSTGVFSQISAYLPNDKALPVIQRLYVKNTQVSTETDEVRSLQLYSIALTQTNPVNKRELLSSALESGRRFTDLIQAAIDKLDGKSVSTDASTERSFADFSATGNINSDNVNVRDLPDEVNGKVVSTLSDSQYLVIEKRTNQQYTVEGVSDYWYFSQEENGWIFGGFINLK